MFQLRAKWISSACFFLLLIILIYTLPCLHSHSGPVLHCTPYCTWPTLLYLAHLTVPGTPYCNWHTSLYLVHLTVPCTPYCTWHAHHRAQKHLTTWSTQFTWRSPESHLFHTQEMRYLIIYSIPISFHVFLPPCLLVISCATPSFPLFHESFLVFQPTLISHSL